MRFLPHARIALIGLPLLMVAVGLLLAFGLRGDGSRGTLDAGGTYEVWLEEAEVSALRGDGAPWDADGSGPDLFGIVLWQGVRILETVVASDGLIARWEPVGIRFSQVMQGEADAASVRRVGRFRYEDEGMLLVGVFDKDPIGADFAGAFEIPLPALRKGRNLILGSGALQRLVLVVVDPNAPDDIRGFQVIGPGVVELDEPPVVMRGALGRMTGDFREQADEWEREARGIGTALRKWFDTLMER